MLFNSVKISWLTYLTLDWRSYACKGTGASGTGGEAERAGTVQHGEEKLWGDLINFLNIRSDV